MSEVLALLEMINFFEGPRLKKICSVCNSEEKGYSGSETPQFYHHV